MISIVRSFAILILLITNFTPLFSQKQAKKDFIRAVQDADIFFYYDEDYEKAAALYESLLLKYPGQSNISAKLGICYLYIDGKKNEAIGLLSYASGNVIENDKDYIEYGEKAPLDTYIYLAAAYHVNDSLEKALALYYEVKKKLTGTEVFREEYIDNQIRDCKYAMEMRKKPVTIISELFIPWLIEFPGACNPVVSKNDSVLVFTQKKENKTRIYCSFKTGTWQRPKDITNQLGGSDKFYSNSITGNGRLLILFSDDGGDGNLFYSQRNDSTWSKIKNMGKPINSIYWESHGLIVPDGKTFYFSSNRPGGRGELDIWVSAKAADGSWGKPLNCGNTINTPYNETTPFFDTSINSLLFSSAGHTSMGGYDVFRSSLKNGVWSNPVGFPYTLNTTEDNTFFIVNNDGPGFITSIYDKTTNSRNIYNLIAIDPADEITIADGIVKLQDGMNIVPEKIHLVLTNSKKGELSKTIDVQENGSFRFELKPGDYQILISYAGYKPDTINLNLPLNSISHYLPIISTLIPEKVSQGEFLSIKNVLFGFDSYKLDDQARSSLEILKAILITHTELRIEVAGYTDASGSSEFNRKLADKRAQAVIDNLVQSGVSSSRFIKKSYGESNFVAANTNSDGSDNPEGRKYNRRVTFGIVDPHTGIVIAQDTYTPEHGKQPFSMRYSIILLKTKISLNDSHFNKLKMNGLLFIRAIKIDTVNLYSLGIFYNRPDAIKYLAFARENGFKDAYIVNQYDLNNESRTLLNPSPVNSKKLYSIQLKAVRRPLNINIFDGINDVKEVKSADGFYRYLYGEYSLYSKAKADLIRIQESGYKDAFIRDVNLLINR